HEEGEMRDILTDEQRSQIRKATAQPVKIDWKDH
ncbi:MAG: hypothetical protein RIR11_3739, partial [Bacteroidota bacterium]